MVFRLHTSDQRLHFVSSSRQWDLGRPFRALSWGASTWRCYVTDGFIRTFIALSSFAFLEVHFEVKWNQVPENCHLYLKKKKKKRETRYQGISPRSPLKPLVTTLISLAYQPVEPCQHCLGLKGIPAASGGQNTDQSIKLQLVLACV